MKEKVGLEKKMRKPRWLLRNLPKGSQYQKVREIVNSNSLATVCQHANCPNQFECYSKNSATFMILGEKCTRNCRFCNVEHGQLTGVDLEEPQRVAAAIENMQLSYAVVTSVTRDDLEDGGAAVFAETIRCIKKRCPNILVEVLIPDLQGNKEALRHIVDAGPDVLNHNVETVKRLYPIARPQAGYERSLQLLKDVKYLDATMVVKTGLMVGLGESDTELFDCFDDIRETECDLLTIGQYLQPSNEHLPVDRYVEPKIFETWREKGLEMGFADVMSGPLVRSSYRAEEMYRKVKKI